MGFVAFFFSWVVAGAVVKVLAVGQVVKIILLFSLQIITKIKILNSIKNKDSKLL